jgi:hypothetical protein
MESKYTPRIVAASSRSGSWCLLLLRPVSLDANVSDIFKILVGALAAKFGDTV